MLSARVLIVAWLAAAFAAMAHAAPSYLVYVTNERSGDVSVIDTDTKTVRATWPIGKRPRGVRVSRDGSRLYVAVSGSPRLGPGADPDRAKNEKADKSADGIAIVDTGTGRVLRKLSVGSDPEQFALSRDERRVIVANEDEATATSWEIESGRRVFSAAVSEEPEGVALHPLLNEVYVTCEQRGEVFVLDADTGSSIAKFTVGGRPRSVAFLPDGSRAYVPAEGEAEVSVVDTKRHQIEQTIKLTGPDVLPMGAVATPDGRTIFVTTGRGNTVAVIDTAKNAMTDAVKVGERPWGIALSPDGATLLAANGRSDDVSVIEVATRKEIARIKVGSGPWGVATASQSR